MKNLNMAELTNRRGRKPKLYLVLDCETATLPFVNEIALNEKEKKNIAIAKPLIYDMAWRIVDRYNNVYAEHSYLIAETFAVPAIFNTAYYKEKRPIYLEKMEKGEMDVVPWNTAAKVLETEMKNVDFVCAYNAMFDFKKAIPFTELYIKKLYSPAYSEWEKMQYNICVGIAKGNKKSSEREFEEKTFTYRGIVRNIIDLWGVSCGILINTITYKKMCLEYNMISESGMYFKTSAESTFRYLQDKYDFNEAHTALEDVIIESQILAKALHRAKIPEGIIFFPFRQLGYTTDFLEAQSEKPKALKRVYFENVLAKMRLKLDEYEQTGKDYSTFAKMLANKKLLVEFLADNGIYT